MLLLFSPWVVSNSARLLCPWDFPSMNTRVGCHFHLQGIFPIQGLNPCLLHSRRGLYHWATRKAHLNCYPHAKMQYTSACVSMLSCIKGIRLCDSMDCNLPGSSIHRIFQARIPEWVAIFISTGASQYRDWNHVSCFAGGFFTTESPGKLF